MSSGISKGSFMEKWRMVMKKEEPKQPTFARLEKLIAIYLYDKDKRETKLIKEKHKNIGCDDFIKYD